MRRTIGLLVALCLIGLARYARADEGRQAVPQSVPSDHWVCQEVRDLAAKYGAPSEAASLRADGRPVNRREVAQAFLRVLTGAEEKCAAEGPQALSDEDRARLVRLHTDLKEDLDTLDSYVERREAIGYMLSKPEEPELLYRTGVAGFVREELARNFSLSSLSYDKGQREDRFPYRAKPFFFWHPTDSLDLHVEGQAYGHRGVGKDWDIVAPYQGFLEARIPGQPWLSVKIGRQEFLYGSAFVLGADSFYDGLSFDAVRVRLKPLEVLSIDLLAGGYATAFSGDVRGDLSGAYATYAFSGANVLEAYVFWDTGAPERRHGERRLSWGARVAAKKGPLSFELEPVLQTGRLFDPDEAHNRDVWAYGGHADVAAEATLLGRKNAFSLSYAFGSGSAEAAKGGYAGREFRNSNNDTSLTGDISVVSDLSGVTAGNAHASGLHIFNGGWGIDALEGLNFSASARYFLADRAPDGASRAIGVEADFACAYAFSETFSLLAAYDHFFPGAFFRDATGSSRGVDYAYLMLQFNVAKTGYKALKK